MKWRFSRKKEMFFLCVALLLTFFLIFILPKMMTGHYVFNDQEIFLEEISTTTVVKEVNFIPNYINTPDIVRGIYMTSWVAGTPNLRDKLVDIVDSTEINSIIIDIKDYSGKIVFRIDNPELKSFGSEEVRVDDLGDFIERLHQKDIYVIGRVAVFQDAHFVKNRPDLAVKTKDGLNIWKDRKGISWIDPGSREYWDYIVLISKESRKIGFDEINFDYIRFPSDGNMIDISYPFSSTTEKRIVLKNFFEYLNNNLKTDGLKMSADIFGMVTTSKDDMGIGQIYEDFLPYFDYISPMIYPSHYSMNFMGYSDPENYPYEIISIATKSAIERSKSASSSVEKLRPWLQDFGLRRVYGISDVKAQIKALDDLGINSWLLWSASNKYNLGALQQN